MRDPLTIGNIHPLRIPRKALPKLIHELRVIARVEITHVAPRAAVGIVDFERRAAVVHYFEGGVAWTDVRRGAPVVCCVVDAGDYVWSKIDGSQCLRVSLE